MISHTALRKPLTARVAAAASLILLLLAALPATAALNRMPDFEQLVKDESPAVVSVRTKHAATAAASAQQLPPGLPEFFRRFRESPDPRGQRGGPASQAIGSGVVASADGYILTNAHVVADADSIIVQMRDQREFEATLVGTDPQTDVALLKVDAGDLTAARFGDSDALNVGQWVLAIGAPFGLQQTATQGIVSAVSRSLPNDNYVPFIQTDVAVNPGNSGGPLFNLEGEVIGINSQIFSRTGGYMGLSFAIPINLASDIAEQLKTNGRITRGWLGISIQDLDQGLADSFGLETPKGALVSAVTPDSPAAAAKLKPGDVIVAYNGQPIDRSAALPPLVAATATASSSVLRVWREGAMRDITVRVGELGGESVAALAPATGPLGVVVSDLTPGERAASGVDNGVRVDGVEPGKAAAIAGVRPDDIIVAFNHEQVDNVAELVELSRATDPGSTVPVLVQRDEQIRFLAVKVPPRQTG